MDRLRVLNFFHGVIILLCFAFFYQVSFWWKWFFGIFGVLLLFFDLNRLADFERIIFNGKED